MQVRIWGARGSHPQPMALDRFQERVRSIVQRIRPVDIANSENRERFLATLPNWLWSMPGGNTPCVEVRLSDNSCLIFDAGTGIISLSKELSQEDLNVFHLFFSHFHYDHIQGLPFFSQIYEPETEVHFYSPEQDVESILKNHMRHPFFPLAMEDKVTPQQHFHILGSNSAGEDSLRFATTKLYWKTINHPGNSYAYKITEAGKTLIIATDYELSAVDFEKTEENSSFFEGADILILDTMYTLGEAIEKFNWGHSSFSIGVDFAHAWKTKRLLLFHHEPQYDDKRLYKNLRNARSYAERQDYTDLDIDIAEEGMEIIL